MRNGRKAGELHVALKSVIEKGIIYFLTFSAAAPSVGALTFERAGPWSFNIKSELYENGASGEMGNWIEVAGREVTNVGQCVYVRYTWYVPYLNAEELEDLMNGDYILLEDGKGNTHEPIGAEADPTYAVDFDFDGKVIRFEYPRLPSGETRAVVRLNEKDLIRLQFGPAGRDYMRVAAVTADEGLNLRAAPDLDADVIEVLPYNAEVFLTGRIRSYVGRGAETPYDLINFCEVKAGDDRGWAADGYLRLGDFAVR